MKLFFRQTIRFLMQADGSPERLALAFSVGVFFGFSPLLGLHTVLGLLCAVAFRLNKVAVLAGVYSNNPWIIVPFYGFATWFGVQLTGLPEGPGLPEFGVSSVFRADFWSSLAAQWRLLTPAFLGSTVLCTILALVAYPVSLFAIRKLKSKSPSRHESAPAG